MVVLAIIAAVIVLILLLRVGVSTEYSEDGVIADAKLGVIRLRVYPREKTKRSGEKKEKDGEKADEKPAKKGGTISKLRELLPPAIRALGRLKRGIRINLLTVHYTAAGNDAYSTAMSYGCANAGIGWLLPLLSNNFTIKKRDIRTAVSFEAQQPYIYVKAELSIAIGTVLHIGLGLLLELLKTDVFKKRKAES